MKIIDLAYAKNLGNGVSRQLLLNGGAVCYTLNATTREAVDTWISEQSQLIEAWPADRPICILGAHASIDHSLIQYMKSRLPQFARVGRGKAGRIALVVGKGFMSHVATLYFKTTGTGGLHLRFFQDREEALNWLQEIAEPA
jgi:hypothetical protein